MTDLKTPQARKADPAIPAMLLGPPYVVYRDEDSISLLELGRLLYAERRLIAVILAAMALISLIAAFSATTRMYRAEVLLAPVSTNKNDGMSALISQFGDIAALVDGYVGSTKDRTAESIATLQSRVLASQFIRERNLKPRLFPDKWDTVKQDWRDPAEVPTDLEAYEVFDKRIRTVNVDRRTGLVSLFMEWEDPELAAKWANELVTAVNERRRAEAVHDAQQSIEYLERQLAQTSSVDIRQSLYRLIEAQTKTIALAHARGEYAFKVIDPAVPPELPVPRRRALIVAVGFLLGVVIAVAAALMRRALQRERAALEPPA